MEAVDGGELSVAEQLALYSGEALRVRLVLGVHGANLANVLWCAARAERGLCASTRRLPVLAHVPTRAHAHRCDSPMAVVEVTGVRRPASSCRLT